MANVLFLVHRLPFPPNKGDKVRSYHLLKHLARDHKVYLGTFVDDPEDEAYVPKVRAMCEDMHASRLVPRTAKLASLAGLLRREPLTVTYYRDRALRQWVQSVASRVRLDAVLVFSSSMAQYAEGIAAPEIVDFVDVDSAKWAQYAGEHRFPLSWLYRREGRMLLQEERRIARRARASFFVTDKEVALFESLAPECKGRPRALGNGVDAEFFAPLPGRESPYPAGEIPIVFTGAMDYWPNVDAVKWFAADMLPMLKARHPAIRFHVVGRSPTPAVQALSSADINVTGTVPDVRPYLQHAAVVVAPLRLARGVQNKVLEAMAMARPVVAAASCVEAIDVVDGQHLVGATDAAQYVESVLGLLNDPQYARHMGESARQRVLDIYGWDARLRDLDPHLVAAA